MKILYALGNDFGGAGSAIAEYVTRNTPHDCKLYLRRGLKDPSKDPIFGTRYERIDYVGNERDALRAAVEWADVIHCYHDQAPSNIASDLLAKRKWVFSWVGWCARPDAFDALWPEDFRKYATFTSYIQGADRFEPFTTVKRLRYRLIPHIVDTAQAVLEPAPWTTRRRAVAFFAKWHDKPNLPDFFAWGPPWLIGSQILNKDQKKLAAALAGIPLDLNFEDRSFQDTCIHRGQVALCIDDMCTEVVNGSGWETLAKATPCVNAMDDYTVRQIREHLGAPNPFLVAHWQDLRTVVERTLALPMDVLAEMGRQAREWIDTYYRPEQMWAHYERLYTE
jgi:hypothetical protein